jgi:hypothetical protein
MEAKVTTKKVLVPVRHSASMFFGSRYKVLRSLAHARAYVRAWGWPETWGVPAWAVVALTGVTPCGVRACLWRLTQWGFVDRHLADRTVYYGGSWPRGACFYEYEIAKRGNRYLRQVAYAHPDAKALWDSELADWQTILDAELPGPGLDTDALTDLLRKHRRIPWQTRTVTVTVTDKPARASKTAPAPEYTPEQLHRSIQQLQTAKEQIAQQRVRRFGVGPNTVPELTDFIERLKAWWQQRGVDIEGLALEDRLALDRRFQQLMDKPAPGPKQQSVPKKPGYWR